MSDAPAHRPRRQPGSHATGIAHPIHIPLASISTPTTSTQTGDEIHLADVPNVPRHVTTDSIEYFESGIWVQADEGRTCFPWGRVTMIRETVGGSPTTTEEPPGETESDASQRSDEDAAQVVADEAIEEPTQ